MSAEDPEEMTEAEMEEMMQELTGEPLDADLTTEGDAREYVADNPDTVLRAGMAMLDEVFFVHHDGEFIIVRNQLGSMGVAEPLGDDTELGGIDLHTIDKDDVPFDPDEAAEAVQSV